MLLYTLKRLIQGLITVWFIATATFLAMHAVPGDPLSGAKAMTPEIRKNLEMKYGLDKPVGQQYLIYMGNLAHGDLGISFTQKNREVNDIIREHFPVSATLGIMAVVFAGLGGTLFGALTALYRNKWPDDCSHSGHFGAELRFCRLCPIGNGQDKWSHRLLSSAGGWLGIGVPHDNAVTGAGPWYHGIPYPFNAQFHAGNHQLGLYPHCQRQGAAADPDIFEA